jgi:serine protease DegQ
MNQIISHGSVVRGWVGVEVQDITSDIAESFSLKTARGALIAGVLQDGPAARAGIRPGDVLQSVNGKEVNSSSDLLETISAVPPGETAKLGILRQGTRLELNVKVEQRPAPQVQEREQ